MLTLKTKISYFTGIKKFFFVYSRNSKYSQLGMCKLGQNHRQVIFSNSFISNITSSCGKMPVPYTWFKKSCSRIMTLGKVPLPCRSCLSSIYYLPSLEIFFSPAQKLSSSSYSYAMSSFTGGLWVGRPVCIVA